MEENRLDQSYHISAGVVTGTHTRYMDQLERERERERERETVNACISDI